VNDVFEYAKNTHSKNKSGFKQELDNQSLFKEEPKS